MIRSGILLSLILLLVSIISCKKDFNNQSQQVSLSSSTLSSFSFLKQNNPGLDSDIVCTISGDSIVCVLPLSVNRDSLVATFTTSDTANAVTVNGVKQISNISINNFSGTADYNIAEPGNTEMTYKVIVYRFTGLPILYLTTDGAAPVTSKYTYVSGQISLDSNSKNFSSYNGKMKMKLHGNSTLVFPKLPYKIKLSSAASLLNMPAAKDWILLANYQDKTLIRNYLGLKESQMFGLPYTPRSQFIELFMNGEYEGNYELTEEIEIDPNRVNITEMSSVDVDSNSVTGGYLMEFDHHPDSTDITFSLHSGLPVTLHDPDDNIAAQNSYIQNYMQQTEDAINADNFTDPINGCAKYLDEETLINWYWVNELTKNNDAVFFSSCWMYKDRNDVLRFGPVWDFDISAGNVNYNGNDNPEGWWVNSALWLQRLFQDTAFTQKAIARWKVIRPSLDSLNTYIDATAGSLQYSEKQNFTRWNILNQLVGANVEAAGSYQGEVDYLKSWMQQRINWIDANLASLQK